MHDKCSICIQALHLSLVLEPSPSSKLKLDSELMFSIQCKYQSILQSCKLRLKLFKFDLFELISNQQFVTVEFQATNLKMGSSCCVGK